MKEKEVLIAKEGELRTLAAEILLHLAHFSGPRIIALKGELGTGKTQFVKECARQLGVSDTITSPTFLLMRRYKVPPSYIEKMDSEFLIHIDAYRIDEKELLQLGWRELISDPKNMVVVEWADRIKELIPRSAVWVHLAAPSPSERQVRIAYE